MVKSWHIRDVPEETKRKIKAYAKSQRMTVAGALVKLAESIDQGSL